MHKACIRCPLAAGWLVVFAWLAGCAPVIGPSPHPAENPRPADLRQAAVRQELVLFAMTLIETGYTFGGKNPSAGLDCSGMVSHVYRAAAGITLRGSAAEMARLGMPVARADLQAGDLVFFNTRGHPASHVGIYLGDGRFVHAPGSAGKVRIDALDGGWYASRFEQGRSYLGAGSGR